MADNFKDIINKMVQRELNSQFNEMIINAQKDKDSKLQTKIMLETFNEHGIDSKKVVEILAEIDKRTKDAIAEDSLRKLDKIDLLKWEEEEE